MRSPDIPSEPGSHEEAPLDRLRRLPAADRRAVLARLPADRRGKVRDLLREGGTLNDGRRLAPPTRPAAAVEPVPDFSPWLATRIAALADDRSKPSAMTEAAVRCLAEVVREIAPAALAIETAPRPSLFQKGFGLLKRGEPRG